MPVEILEDGRKRLEGAREALKLLMGVGEPLTGRLLLLDVLSMQWRSVKFKRDFMCKVCGGR